MPASAEWVPLPGGDWAYQTEYSTTGFFTCAATYAKIGMCAASGNTVVLTNGGASMTLTFTGTTGTLLIDRQANDVPLGVMEMTLSGDEPFEVPPRIFTGRGVFSFTGLLTASPPGGTDRFGVTYITRGDGVLRTGPIDKLAEFPLEPYPPTGAHKTLVFKPIRVGNIRPDGQPRYWVAVQVNVVPEPGTTALVASGLAALAAIGWRRARP